MILLHDQQLEMIEKSYQWIESIDYCQRRWKSDPDSLQLFMRYFTQQWFLTSYFYELFPFWEMGTKDRTRYYEAYSVFQSDAYLDALKMLRRFGDEHFAKEPIYLCLSGYMMTHAFEYMGNQFEEIIAEGNTRLLHVMNSADGECALFSKSVKEYVPLDENTVDAMFPGHSAFDESIKCELEDVRRGR